MVTIPLSSTRGNILSFTITIFFERIGNIAQRSPPGQIQFVRVYFFEQNEAKNAKILLFRGTRFLAFTYYK